MIGVLKFTRSCLFLSITGLILSLALWGLSYSRVSFSPPGGSPFVFVHNGAIGVYALNDIIPWFRWDDPQGHRLRKPGEVRRFLMHMAVTVDGSHTPRVGQYVDGVHAQGFRSWWTVWKPRWSSMPRVYDGVAVPLWMPAVGCLLATLFLGVAARRRRRVLGLCVTCGYDLRSSPVLCPECGAEPAY